MLASSSDYDGTARIKVVGLGGGGSNAASRMFRERIPGVEYVVVNSDAQALLRSDVPLKIRIGDQLTGGKGVGGNPELGMKCAEESREELYEVVRDSDMVFLAVGMGGGTGTGTAPVLAQIAKETGALTVGVVTRPFSFEGLRRAQVADDGINRLRQHVDTLLVIPNERLQMICEEEITAENAFRMADDVLRLGVQSIAELESWMRLATGVFWHVALRFQRLKGPTAHPWPPLAATRHCLHHRAANGQALCSGSASVLLSTRLFHRPSSLRRPSPSPGA